MIKWLNYHHLLYFRVIASEGSLAKASKTLLVGQPALSAQLKQLEASLGQQLFERKNRSLILTEAGKIALEYANEIFKKGEEFVQVFNDKSLGLKKHFRAAIVDGAPKTLATSLVECAQKAGDNCFVSIEEGTPDSMVKSIINHEFDICITNNIQSVYSDEVIITSLGKHQVNAYGSKKFLKAKDKFPKSLKNKKFILPTRHSKLRYDLEHFFKDNLIQYDLVAEVQDSAVKKLMGEHGMGIIFLPEFAPLQLVKEKKLFKLGSLDGVFEEFWLIQKKLTLKNPITDEVVKKFKIK